MLRGDFIKHTINVPIEVPVRRNFNTMARDLKLYVDSYIRDNVGVIINTVMYTSNLYYTIPYRYSAGSIVINKIKSIDNMSGYYTVYAKVTFDCIIVFKHQLITKFEVITSSSQALTNGTTCIVDLNNIRFNLAYPLPVSESSDIILESLVYVPPGKSQSSPLMFNGFYKYTNNNQILNGTLDVAMLTELKNKKIIPDNCSSDYKEVLQHINASIASR